MAEFLKILNPTNGRFFLWAEGTHIHTIGGYHDELMVSWHDSLELSCPDGKALAVLRIENRFGEGDPWKMEIGRLPKKVIRPSES